MSVELGQEALLQALLQTKKPGSVLAALATFFVPEVATWCEVHLIPGDSPRRSAARHRDDAKTGPLLERAERFPFNPEARFGVPSVIRSGEPERIEVVPPALLPGLFPDPEEFALVQLVGYASTLTLPLKTTAGVLGAALLVREAGPFLEADVAPLQHLLDQAASVLERLLELERLSAALRSERRARRTYQAQALRYEGRLDANPLSTMTLDARGYTVAVNRAFEPFWGITIEDDVAYNVSLFNDEQLRASGMHHVFERALRGEAVLGPPTFYAPPKEGGRAQWFRHMIAPVVRPGGRVRELVVVHVPLADEEQTEAVKRLSALGLTLPDPASPGDGRLSPRERAVLRLLAEGFSNRDISNALAISENTVKFHVTSLFNKLGVNSRAQAVTAAVHEGLL